MVGDRTESNKKLKYRSDPNGIEEYLMSEEGCVSAKEALEKAKKKWKE